MPSRLLPAAALLLAHAVLAAPSRFSSKADPVTGSRTFELWDGTTATVGPDGLAWRTAPAESSRGSAAQRRSAAQRPGDTNRGSVAPRPGDTNRGSAAHHVPYTGRSFWTFARPQADDFTLLRALSLPRRDIAVDRVVPGTRPEFWASSMAIEPRALDGSAALPLALARAAAVSGLPSNYGLRTSLQAHLNANGVNATGAFVDLARRFGQLPGQGVRITNVSIGDLMDQSMADAGDTWVQFFGPTTRVINGQRYLDYPSLPLIPTWTSDDRGNLDPLGTVEFVDPFLGEVLLDFSVMAPLPSDRQRPEARGDGLTDLLGIAPGAQYRLIVPKDPTISNIYTALLAAARQQPRPDVITASLGFGFDSVGYPGRYLEDDPVGQAVVGSIVQQGIVVCISSNDGTRLFTPTAIGPDGGSAPTDRLRSGETPTSTDDDFATTIATRVADSGAIAVGGTTLDDIFSAPPQAGGPLAHVGQFPQTRYNGAASFSSGFGTRIDIAAPSDGIVALAHQCTQDPCTPQDAIPVLSGGTSASAPMVAAAAAVVIQAARLMHKKLTPLQVRDLLVRTGRPLAQAPQADRTLAMGTQLDVTAALEAVLGTEEDDDGPSIARLSVAHRRELGDLGAAFREDTDPAAIDLAGPLDFDGNPTGQWLAGPITIAADVVNASSDLQYALIVGRTELVQGDRAFRLLPSELLAAAGLPVVSSGSRSVDVRYEVRRRGKAVASVATTLVFGPSDGLITEPLAPVAPALAGEGQDVVVHYDLTGMRFVDAPTLFVSGIGHWSPFAAPLFHPDSEIPLRGLSGSVRIPGSSFRGGAGLYGIGIRPQTSSPDVGQIAVIRITAASPARPDAPLLADASGRFGHIAAISRAASKFTLRWNASGMGDGAALEVSAPAPTLRNGWNTFSNANGSRRDADGIDSPSMLFVRLPSASGEKAFDAVDLGIAPGLLYNLRIVALRGGAPAGETSPSSMLQVDDVALPAGVVTSFDLAGEGSVAATATGDASGNLVSTALVLWSPGRAQLGATVASDPTGSTVYELFGRDSTRNLALAARWPWTGSVQTLETWDTTTWSKLHSLDVDAFTEYFLLTARIDSTHHRAPFLAFDSSFALALLPFDLASGTFGPPVHPALGPNDFSFYNSMTLDPVTGTAFIAAASVTELCIFRSGPLTSVDLDTGATASGPMDSCTTGLVADGKKVHVAHGPIISNNVLLPPARMQHVSEKNLVATPSVFLGAKSPVFPAVDTANQVLVVGFLAGEDYELNSNATSAVGAFDLRSGKRLFYSPAFNFAQAVLGGVLDPLTLRGIQLDPKTRTGWTIAAGAQQLQRFSY